MNYFWHQTFSKEILCAWRKKSADDDLKTILKFYSLRPCSLGVIWISGFRFSRLQKGCWLQMGLTTRKTEPHKWALIISVKIFLRGGWVESGLRNMWHQERAEWDEKARESLSGKPHVQVELLWPTKMESLDTYVCLLGACRFALSPREMARLLQSCKT